MDEVRSRTSSELEGGHSIVSRLTVERTSRFRRGVVNAHFPFHPRNFGRGGAHTSLKRSTTRPVIRTSCLTALFLSSSSYKTVELV